MTRGTREAAFVLLATSSMSSFAQWTVELTVPLEVNALIERVTRVDVRCLVYGESQSAMAIGGAVVSVPVDVKTGRPIQDRAVVRITPGSSGAKDRPTKYTCWLIPAFPVSQGGFLPASRQTGDMAPAPGTPLVDEVSGALPAP